MGLGATDEMVETGGRGTAANAASSTNIGVGGGAAAGASVNQ